MYYTCVDPNATYNMLLLFSAYLDFHCIVTFLLTDHVSDVISIYIKLNNTSLVSIMELLYDDGFGR